MNEVKEIRSKWKYPEPKITIKNKLDSIFEAFDKVKVVGYRIEN
jgi:hypothetical protein